MSKSEKVKVFVGVTVWLLVGVIGFVYFWTTNPERKMRAIIEPKEAIKVYDALVTQLSIDLPAQANTGKLSHELPEKFSNTTIDPKVREVWPRVIKEAIDVAEKNIIAGWGVEAEDVEFTGDYVARGEWHQYSNEYGFTEDGNVRIGVCKQLDVPIKITNPEYPDNEVIDAGADACVALYVDKNTGTITDVRHSQY